MTGPANRNAPESHWAGITALVKELRRCEAAGASLAALVMAYVCIDAMAYLAMSPDRSEQTKQDFIAWVDGYLKAHPDQPYQYRVLTSTPRAVPFSTPLVRKPPSTERTRLFVSSGTTTAADTCSTPQRLRTSSSLGPFHFSTTS